MFNLLALISWWTILKLFLTYLVVLVVLFYLKLKNYPPGPLPLPLIGNILLFCNYRKHWNWVLISLTKTYGPVITIWIGPMPIVFICDLNNREAMNQWQLSGRAKCSLLSILSNNHQMGILGNEGKPVEIMRKLVLTTIRKYAKSDDLSQLCAKSVSKMFDKIIANEGLNQAFDPKCYLDDIIYLISGQIVFNENIVSNHPKVLEKFIYNSTKILHESGNQMLLYDFLPNFLKIFMKNPFTKVKNYHDHLINFTKNVYKNNEQTYNGKICRNFCDNFINAKQDAIVDNKKCLQYLSDDNIVITLIDLFLALIETTPPTLHWMILLLAYYPDVQLKLRNELDKFIMSTSSSSNSSITTNVEQQQQSIGPNHKHQFPYTMAFIYETLRFRNVVPFGLLHRSMAKTTIDNKYPVPDNTVVLFNHYAILMDDQHWPSARTFKPERFLSGFNDNDNTNNDNQTTTTTSSGQLASSRVRLNKSQAFMPFGFGRRQCLGIKLAVNELFYVLVQFLRLTNNYDIVYDTNCTDKLQSTTTGATGNDVDDDVDNVLDGDNISVIDQLTKPYKIILKTKSN